MFDGQRLSMNINDVTAAMGSPAVSPSRNMKSRQHLQLPTFKSLGIAAPHPDVLLTPPDEHDNIHWANPSEDLSHIPTNSPYHRPMSMASEGTTPETPLVSEFVSATGGETPKSSQPTASQASAPMVTPTGEGILHLSASSTQSENSDERTAWLKGAVEVTCKLNPSQKIQLTNSPSINHVNRWRPPTCDQCSLPHPTLSTIRRRHGRPQRLHIPHFFPSSPSRGNPRPLY